MAAIDEEVDVVAGHDIEQIRDRFHEVRGWTDRLCEPLGAEDCVVQSMPDVSPTRWHMAHTTWFFETFVLGEAVSNYQPFHPAFGFLFNSYYNAVGEQFPRDRRGLLTRPTVAEIRQYREEIDQRMDDLLLQASPGRWDELLDRIVLGIEHEQQHQELILTDIKHVLSCNPLWPVYRQRSLPSSNDAGPLTWRRFPGGETEIGSGESGFCFDNELPRHRVLLQPFEIGSRLVTAGDFLEFIEDDGYQRPDLWLSLGWATVCEQGWDAPLYWERKDGAWYEFTLAGLRPLRLDAPVAHVSYFEADAFARWSGARLLTEFEWEAAADEAQPHGTFLEDEVFAPQPAPYEPPARRGDRRGAPPRQLLGDCWEWTSSSYAAYPGFVPTQGSLGEYNGKFMCNQYVLRGGSCVTSRTHIRRSYRNFFPPDARWQFSGIRLARYV